MMKTVIEIITILIVLLPPVVQITSVLAQKSHSAKLKNLSDRATIVVNALEQSELTSQEKRAEGLKALSKYANEVGIAVTDNQVSEYLEAAVRFMKLATQNTK